MSDDLKRLVIGGTGHRPNKLGGYSSVIDDQIVLVVGTYLDNRIKDLSVMADGHQTLVVISGLAQGFDLGLAETALSLIDVAAKLGVRVEVWGYAPCYNQQQMWPPAATRRYERVRNQLTRMVYVTKSRYTVSCMHKRDKRVVDDSHEILALWNGEPSGGTSYTVRYAMRMKKPITNLWDQFRGST